MVKKGVIQPGVTPGVPEQAIESAVFVHDPLGSGIRKAASAFEPDRDKRPSDTRESTRHA